MTGDAEPVKSVQVRIEGRVQGVWYRGWTADEAIRRGLRGWVRNHRDGSVEAVFAGPKSAVDAMLDACWQGPPAARVTAVLPRPADHPDDSTFRMLPTE